MFSFFNKTLSDNTKTFFDFKINSINGEELDLSTFNGKAILLVNVASKCGFTKQYDDLQKLYENFTLFITSEYLASKGRSLLVKTKKSIEKTLLTLIKKSIIAKIELAPAGSEKTKTPLPLKIKLSKSNCYASTY